MNYRIGTAAAGMAAAFALTASVVDAAPVSGASGMDRPILATVDYIALGPGPIADQGRGQGQQARPQDQGQQARPQDQGRGQGQQARPQNQGRGQGQQARPQDQGRGQGPAMRGGNAPRGWTGGRVAPDERQRWMRELPTTFQPLRTSSRPADRLLLSAAALAAARGFDAAELRFDREASATLVRNRRGDVLFDLPDDRARDLGAWDMRRLGDQRPRGNAPSFCRSGEGHPVWGREWCLDKGFGLGSRAGTIWSRSRVDDVIFGRRVDQDRLTRDVLIDVLGDVVFNRLAVHALTLGYADPLFGLWTSEPESPDLLRVYAGDVAVAEFVDLDRDGRVDVLYVVQPF
jgi:hypothetical protein